MPDSVSNKSRPGWLSSASNKQAPLVYSLGRRGPVAAGKTATPAAPEAARQSSKQRNFDLKQAALARTTGGAHNGKFSRDDAVSFLTALVGDDQKHGQITRWKQAESVAVRKRDAFAAALEAGAPNCDPALLQSAQELLPAWDKVAVGPSAIVCQFGATRNQCNGSGWERSKPAQLDVNQLRRLAVFYRRNLKALREQLEKVLLELPPSADLRTQAQAMSDFVVKASDRAGPGFDRDMAQGFYQDMELTAQWVTAHPAGTVRDSVRIEQHRFSTV